MAHRKIQPPPQLKEMFAGYPTPTNNTTYTPNQFFDVVLPYSSRGCVRLVAYMIRKTLGWCDTEGNPQETQIVISYSDLVRNAGISRDMIRRAIDEAIEGGFLLCVRQGQPKSAGQPALSAHYELRWDESNEYTTTPKRFSGFFAGQGNLTYIPNAFLDYTVRTEPLAVVKVVGAIIRHTIGWQTKYGFRRQEVQMSYSEIQRRTHIGSRQTLSQALQKALNSNHVFKVSDGRFDPNAAKESMAAKYAIKWADNATLQRIGQKTVPEEAAPNRSENRTRNGQKNRPGPWSENRTDIKIKQENKTFEIKQQQAAPEEPVAAVLSSNSKVEGYQLLFQQGFSKRDATALADRYPLLQIQNQINWLEKRNPTRNPLGFLRRAIEENWGEPTAFEAQSVEFQNSLSVTFARNFYAGRNGSNGEPVGGGPSRNDLIEAEAFVARLLAVVPDENRIPELGRRFGEYVSEKERRNERPIISLVNSLRTQGNAYFQEVQSNRRLELRMAHESARQSHFARFQPTYLDFLRESERKAKREQPDWYQRWNENVQSNRFTFTAQKTEKGRLYAFARDANLPDFWQWDRKHNPAAFQPEKVNV